jgi:hypothetical protein
MSLIIWDKVNTPSGKGILTSVSTPGNGLYIDYENAKCSVYYEPSVEYEAGVINHLYPKVWISREWSYKEILKLNQDLIRDNKLNKLL